MPYLPSLNQNDTNITEYCALTAIKADGSIKWTVKGEASSWLQSPAISSTGIVYFHTESFIDAFAENGSLLWNISFPYDNQLSDPMVVGDGGVEFVRGTDLYRFDQNGVLIWNITLPNNPNNENGIMFDKETGATYVLLDGYLTAIKADGTIAWRTYSGWSSIYQPVLTKNHRIVVFIDETLKCYNATITGRGEMIWETEPIIPGFSFGPSGIAIGSDGTIYFEKASELTLSTHLLAINEVEAEKERGQEMILIVTGIVIIGVLAISFITIVRRKKHSKDG
jgi:hypothetical protein